LNLGAGFAGKIADRQSVHGNLLNLQSLQVLHRMPEGQGEAMSGHQSDACCAHEATFDGLSASYRRRLWLVIATNATMFFVEMLGGHLAGSQALKADALDFLADSLTYGLSLAVIGMPLRVRAGAAFLKGASLLGMGLWVAASTAWQAFILGVPEAPVMGAIGFLALAANVGSVLLLLRYKDGDANVRSVWLCSRNDAIGNIAVMTAAGLVWLIASPWPDIVVAAAMAALFLNSSAQILKQAWNERRQLHAQPLPQ
jgi:Co/Zn/Cd efflux system component